LCRVGNIGEGKFRQQDKYHIISIMAMVFETIITRFKYKSVFNSLLIEDSGYSQ